MGSRTLTPRRRYIPPKPKKPITGALQLCLECEDPVWIVNKSYHLKSYHSVKTPVKTTPTVVEKTEVTDDDETEEQELPCDQCPAVFYSDELLQKHTKRHLKKAKTSSQ